MCNCRLGMMLWILFVDVVDVVDVVVDVVEEMEMTVRGSWQRDDVVGTLDKSARSRSTTRFWK